MENIASLLLNNYLQFSIALLILIFLWHRYFWQPFDKFMDFTDVGFESASKNNKKRLSTVERRNLINDLNKRKKAGALPPIYPNGWFAILESDELVIGKATEVYALGQNLVAWRGDSGASYVADAYCPHLGAHLGVGGTVNGECIKCPFHGWAFGGGDGKLANIPYADCEAVSKVAKLKMWTTFESNGYIFMWHHAEDEQPTWWPEIIPEIHSGEWKYRGRTEHRVAGHIQDLFENGADIAHLNILHHPIILDGNNPTDARVKWTFLNHGWSGNWEANPNPGKSHEALVTINHCVTVFGVLNIFKLKIRVIQTGPGFVILFFDTVIGNGVLIQTVTPIDPLLQRVTHRFYSSRSLLHPIGRVILSTEATQVERDIRIWNRKTYLSNPTLTKEDKLIKAFRHWFSQFYSHNSPRYIFNKENSRGIEF